jgi:acetyl esterase/lipase
MPRLQSLLLLLACAVTSCWAADYQIQANIRYAHFGETLLDILQPPHPAMKDRIGILMIHGGGWIEGSKEAALPFCLPFVAQDFVVANVEYRLANAAPAPAALQDVLAAAKWFHDHAAEYHVDPNRIVAVGDSAGGQLALMAAMLPAQNEFGPVTKIAAVIDFYGVADLLPLLNNQPGNFILQWFGARYDIVELARKLSPINYVRKDVPPVLAIHGDADKVVPYSESVHLVEALQQAGRKAELITVRGGGHGFTDPQSAALWPQIFKWMKKTRLNP